MLKNSIFSKQYSLLKTLTVPVLRERKCVPSRHVEFLETKEGKEIASWEEKFIYNHLAINLNFT